jgi:uncharacterized RDD family membrane protein YckC
MAQCTICRNEFAESDVVKLGEHSVCAECKPVFIQRLREGLPISSSERVYGGFWIRVAAQVLDWIILWIVGYVIGLLVTLLMEPIPGMVLRNVLSVIINVGYVTYFIGGYGATPGKMACGLKVIRADGGKVSYGRALGRTFAQGLSGLLLCIGYIMVAFDEEKRGLHDRICDTRVVKE